MGRKEVVGEDGDGDGSEEGGGQEGEDMGVGDAEYDGKTGLKQWG